MNKLIEDIIRDFNLPKPIGEEEAVGKTIKEFYEGYIIFTDNTMISLIDDEVCSPEEYGYDFIFELGFYKTSKYHKAYLEYSRRLKSLERKKQREKDLREFKRLKKKLGK